MFKDKDGALKEPTGKQIEPRALELGNSHLHRKVQGEDLFAREAQFHPSCRSLFNLRYLNHLRDTARATKDVKNRNRSGSEGIFTSEGIHCRA